MLRGGWWEGGRLRAEDPIRKLLWWLRLETVEVGMVSSAGDGEVAVAEKKIDMKESVEVAGSGHRECLMSRLRKRSWAA